MKVLTSTKTYSNYLVQCFTLKVMIGSSISVSNLFLIPNCVSGRWRCALLRARRHFTGGAQCRRVDLSDSPLVSLSLATFWTFLCLTLGVDTEDRDLVDNRIDFREYLMLHGHMSASGAQDLSP